MKTNQAFAILQKSGGVRAAKIIIRDKKNLSLFSVLYAAHQLRHGVPVAKIVHKKWFYGLEFYTNKYTLDPRPDSETMIDAILKEKNSKEIRILDLGTGTGCLIASVVKNLPNASGIAIDKSFGAIRVAKRNIKNLGLKDKIKILHHSFNSKTNLGQFDIIISNPPYIAFGDKRVDIGAQHDPKIALYAKNNGLRAYEIIAKTSKRWLKPNGKIYLEIGDGQGFSVREIFINQGWNFLNSFDDLTGTERVLCFSI